ncbi:MAG TPA: aldehyde dehydrogenase family protein [Bacteroidetes bacterium]|nr:aldehyde dehydrogenase family protein [Bacteroidota bacterium]
MKTYPIFVGGVFRETATDLPVRNPYSGEIVAATYLAGESELEDAIRKAQEVSGELQALPGYSRYNILESISSMISAERERFARVLAMESGKPLKYALAEIDRAIQVFHVAAEESRRLPREYISLDWTPAGVGKEGLIKYFPLGLVAGIAPFNFPLNLAVHKIAPAMAAGNAIILKPARSTPLSVLELAKLIHRSGWPAGGVSILPMDRKAGNQLVTDERIHMLSFTGSPEVGWAMKNQAGKKKVLLELGGNAGVVISRSADLDTAVSKCVSGGFAYSGQVCIHVQRIFVHTYLFDSFLEKFVAGAGKLKYGDPLDPDTDISVMIDEENALRVEEWIREAEKGGAKVLRGGIRRGSFVEPTILSGTLSDMKVCALEVFGPVVSVEPFDDFSEAIRMINDSRYGLQAGVFTRDLAEEQYAIEYTRTGAVIMNDVPTFRVDHMPYGGVKDSGFGREGLKYAITEMMEPRLLVRSRLI